MVSKNPISCFHFDDYQLDALHRGLPQNDPLKRDEEKKKKKLSFTCVSRSLQALKELGVIWACVTKVLGVGPILPLTHFHHFPITPHVVKYQTKELVNTTLLSFGTNALLVNS